MFNGVVDRLDCVNGFHRHGILLEEVLDIFGISIVLLLANINVPIQPCQKNKFKFVHKLDVKDSSNLCNNFVGKDDVSEELPSDKCSS
jgi:hypothetical protein